MVLSSNKQWVCQFLKGEEDKWREGTKGCEDNGFLWWLTFQSDVSKKVWLCYCVFTDSQMNGGLGTGFLCGSESDKHSMSNLHLGGWNASVSEHLHVYRCVNWDWHSRPFLLLWWDPHLQNAASVTSEWALLLWVHESAGELTNRSISLSGGIIRFPVPLLWHTCHLKLAAPAWMGVSQSVLHHSSTVSAVDVKPLISFPNSFILTSRAPPTRRTSRGVKDIETERGCKGTDIKQIEMSLLQRCHFNPALINYGVWHNCIFKLLFHYNMRLSVIISSRWALKAFVTSDKFIPNWICNLRLACHAPFRCHRCLRQRVLLHPHLELLRLASSLLVPPASWYNLEMETSLKIFCWNCFLGHRREDREEEAQIRQMSVLPSAK